MWGGGGDLHLFDRLFVTGWENNRDCAITMPLPLKTMEARLKGTNEIRGLERCRATDVRRGYCIITNEIALRPIRIITLLQIKH